MFKYGISLFWVDRTWPVYRFIRFNRVLWTSDSIIPLVTLNFGTFQYIATYQGNSWLDIQALSIPPWCGSSNDGQTMWERSGPLCTVVISTSQRGSLCIMFIYSSSFPEVGEMSSITLQNHLPTAQRLIVLDSLTYYSPLCPPINQVPHGTLHRCCRQLPARLRLSKFRSG